MKSVPRRLAIIALLLSGIRPAYAQLGRIEADWNGERGIRETTQQFPPHPLQFYLSPSAQRDPSNSLCLGCEAVVGHKTTLRDYAVETSQRIVGKSFGSEIIEIVLSFRVGPAMQKLYRQEAARETPGSDAAAISFEKPVAEWKSIVMETPGGLYRELYLIIDTGTWIRPFRKARLLTFGGTQVLATTDLTNFGGCTEGYWTLDHSGPQLIDFSAVDNEIRKLTPSNASAVETGCGSLSMGELVVRSPIQSEHPACVTCDYLGTVIVHFKIQGSSAIPISSSFDHKAP